MSRAHRLLLACALAACGCEQVSPDISWERMLDQPRGKAYRASAYFPDGKLMQAPPEGSVPADRALEPSELREGLSGEQYVSALPLPVTRALLVRGRDRFEIFCAACHGLDGSGESIVAHNMELRRPPSLVSAKVRAFPPGRVFQVIGAGYGLMPGHASELPVQDRWAVVAYLRALARSQASPLASLPQALRQRAEQRLP